MYLNSFKDNIERSWLYKKHWKIRRSKITFNDNFIVKKDNITLSIQFIRIIFYLIKPYTER